MPARTPEERALIARIANATRLAKTPDRAELTANARLGLFAKFERTARENAPAATPDVIARMAQDEMRAHMLRMSLKAAQGRRRAREHTASAEAAEAELRDLSGDAA